MTRENVAVMHTLAPSMRTHYHRPSASRYLPLVPCPDELTCNLCQYRELALRHYLGKGRLGDAGGEEMGGARRGQTTRCARPVLGTDSFHRRGQELSSP